MTELVQTWRVVLDPRIEGWDAWVGERKPRRRKHHMRERRKLDERLDRRDISWLQLRTWAERGLAAQREA